jgi:hypothetical protein
VVKVLDTGFEYDSRRYKSLSAIARERVNYLLAKVFDMITIIGIF